MSKKIKAIAFIIVVVAALVVGNKAYAQYAMRQKVLKHQIELRQAAEAKTMADLAAEVKQAAAQAEKDRLAAEAAKWVKEEYGDSILARVSFIGMVDPSSMSLFNSNPYYFIKKYHMDTFNGYRIRDLSMSINRKNGLLTITFGCDFLGTPTSVSRMLVRLFDANGEYLNHFVTKEYFAAPGCRYHSNDPNSCSGAMPLTADSNFMRYQIAIRDAAFVQQAEFGQYTNQNY